MSNPKFKHFFYFKSIPEIGRVEIDEPFGFDASTLNFKQDKKRYGRDIFIFNEKIEFTVTRGHFKANNKPQPLVNGNETDYLYHTFDYVLDIIENEGWEGQIEYILFYNGKDFNAGIVSLFTQESSYNEIKFNIIQDGNAQKIERRKDIFTNLFSTKTLDDAPINPVKTDKILIKAKPVYQISKWEGNATPSDSFRSWGVGSLAYYFFEKTLIQSDVESSLVNIDTKWTNTTTSLAEPLTSDDLLFISDMSTLVQAKNNLSNLKVDINNVNISINTDVLFYTVKLVVVVGHLFSEFETPTNSTTHVLEDFTYNDSSPHFNIVNKNYSIGIDQLGRNRVLRLMLIVQDTRTVQGQAFFDVHANIGTINISASSTAIDSVVRGVRLIDMMKYNVKSISNLDVESSIYDRNGRHYNNYVFNGYMLGADLSKPINVTFENITNILPEQNADYQINDENLEIEHFDFFYQNNEVDFINTMPDNEIKKAFIEGFFLKSIDIGFKKSSNERETNKEYTSDDVHTKAQYMFDTNKAERVLKREFNHIRSAHLIEEQRRKANEIDKSLQHDESLFLIDVVDVLTPERSGFSTTLTYKIIDSRLTILNDGTFRWDTLGFEVGDEIIVNGIARSVLIISPEKVTLTYDAGVTITEEEFLSLEYPLTNVKYKLRTNEGFNVITGVYNPENYANLKYSIKRILIEWYSYLATAGMYLRNKSIKNTMFKINGELSTFLIGDQNSVSDKAEILINEIESFKKITPRIITASYFVDFDKAVNILNKTKETKGYLRVKIGEEKYLKGYVSSLEYEIKTGKLELSLTEKYENNMIDVSVDSGKAWINFTGYNAINFNINIIFVTIYDENDVKIIENIRFSNISIEGVFYENKSDFANAMNNLINSI